MRHVPKPATCQSASVAETTRQKDLRSYPHLLKFGLRVARAAARYDAHQGNPLVIRPARLTATEKEELLHLYKSPPKKLDYIEDMRAGLAGETCPMCGGQDPVTLDHFLPRATHTEFALLSYNLVPACACNSKRGRVVADAAHGTRILHPYYDACMNQPLFTCDFSPDDHAPTFAIRLLLAQDHPQRANVGFHVQNVVLKTSFRTFLGKRWQRLKELPDDMLFGNRPHRDSMARFKSYLDDLCASKARLEGANAWETVFYRSIAEPTIAAWIFDNT